MRLSGGPRVAVFRPGPKIEAGVPSVLWLSSLNALPTRHLWDVSPDGQRILLRTQVAQGAQAGRGGAGVAQAVFDPPAGQAAVAPARGAGAGVPGQAASASNGLTVVRHWTAVFRKAAK